MKSMKWIPFAVLVLALAACAKPPQAEIDAARAKVAQAEKDPEVLAYAPETLAKARDALARMERELGAKRYDQTKAAALEAAQLADRAPADARANKEKVKSQAAALIEEAKKALEALRANLATALKQRIPGLDGPALGREVDAAAQTLADAETALGSGDFLKARDSAAAAQASIADIERRIAEAVQKARKKK